MTARTRVIGATAITMCLLGPVSAALLSDVPDRMDRPLANDRAGAIPHPVDLVNLPDGVEQTRLVPLWRVGAGDLSVAEQVDLTWAAHRTSPTILAAELMVGSCAFVLPRALEFTDGVPVTLHRRSECTDASSTTGLLRLTVKGPGRVAWWAWEMPATELVQHHGLTMTSPDYRGPTRSIMRGRIGWSRHGQAASRAELLSWLHGDESGRAVGLWMLVLLGASFAGAVLMTSARLWPAAMGGGAIAWTLATAWGLIIPPLQGADEPDHVLSAMEVTRRPEAAAALPAFAQRVHFERIRWQSYERFTPADREEAFPIGLAGDIYAEPMNNRSPVTAMLWWLTAPPEHAGPAGTIRHMRLVNALTFGVVVTFALAVLHATLGQRSGWLLAGAALMPTLPYFGAMVSDWAFLSAWSVLLGAGLVLLMHGTTHRPWAGPLIGVSTALLLGSGMAGIPILPVCAAAIFGYLVMGEHRRPLIFWGGLLCGGLLAWWFLADVMSIGFSRFDAGSRPEFQRLLAMTNGAMAIMGALPWLPVALCGVGWIAERALHSLRERGAIETGFARAGRAAAAIVTIGAAVQLLGSTMLTYPELPTLETRAVSSPLEYLGRVGVSLLTAARIRDFDLLTFASLWGGYGWLDAILPAMLLAPIVVILSATWIAVWRSASDTAAGMTLVIVAGSIASVLCAIVAVAMMSRNLHGRYLLPVIVPATIAVTSSAGMWIAHRSKSVGRWGAALLLAVLHGVSLCWVLLRYV